jgi:hypothetical protein
VTADPDHVGLPIKQTGFREWRGDPGGDVGHYGIVTGFVV